MKTFTTYSDTEAITWRNGPGGVKLKVRVERNDPKPHRSPRPPRPSERIVCPTCEAMADEPCRSATGATLSAARSHPDRLQPRVCSCGGALMHRRVKCPECVAAGVRESKRKYARRQRAGSGWPRQEAASKGRAA